MSGKQLVLRQDAVYRLLIGLLALACLAAGAAAATYVIGLIFGP